MYGVSKVNSKGQMTLPKKVRNQLGVEAGDTVIFNFDGDQLVIRKAMNIEKYFNSLPPLDYSYKEKLASEIGGVSRSKGMINF